MGAIAVISVKGSGGKVQRISKRHVPITVSVFTPATSEGTSEMLLRLELSSESGPDTG